MKDKTEAAKVLLKDGWSREEIRGVLEPDNTPRWKPIDLNNPWWTRPEYTQSTAVPVVFDRNGDVWVK